MTRHQRHSLWLTVMRAALVAAQRQRALSLPVQHDDPGMRAPRVFDVEIGGVAGSVRVANEGFGSISIRVHLGDETARRRFIEERFVVGASRRPRGVTCVAEGRLDVTRGTRLQSGDADVLMISREAAAALSCLHVPAPVGLDASPCSDDAQSTQSIQNSIKRVFSGY